MSTSPYLDNHNLTLSPREVENLEACSLGTTPLKPTLLSRLSDRPHNKLSLFLDEMNKTTATNSEETSLQGSKESFRISERRKSSKSRLFTKSWELPEKLKLMSKSDRQQLTTTPLRLTSLMHNKEVQNNEENTPLSWLELAMKGEMVLTPTDASHVEKKLDETDQTMKLGGSCETFEDSSQGSAGNKARQAQTTRMMTQPRQMERENQTRRDVYFSPSYHGTQSRRTHRIVKSMKTERRRERSSRFSNETSPLQKETYGVRRQHPKDSQTQNGNASSEEKPSTSTSSLAISTTLPLLRRMLATSEEQKYHLEAQIWLERSKRVATGPPHGMQPSKQRRTPFHTETTSYDSGETTYLQNSQRDERAPITNLSLSTRQSGLVSEQDRQS